jgi:hypothetical protein
MFIFINALLIGTASGLRALIGLAAVSWIEVKGTDRSNHHRKFGILVALTQWWLFRLSLQCPAPISSPRTMFPTSLSGRSPVPRITGTSQDHFRIVRNPGGMASNLT